MNPQRLTELFARYRHLRIVIVGDFCLDRYLEIDPSRSEISIETGLPVFNVTRVRAQPGAAGTVLNNLVSLGVGTLIPVGFHGCDGEGYELRRAMGSLAGVDLRHFIETPLRRTFTYTKPLLIHENAPPEELSRLDLKNWSATPPHLDSAIAKELLLAAVDADAVIVMDQTDLPEVGTVTPTVLQALASLHTRRPELPVFADSRSGLGRFPSCRFKLNRRELCSLIGIPELSSPEACGREAANLARKTRQPVYVSMAEDGILCAQPGEETCSVPALKVRGPIDVVGAGDCVTANIAAATAAGAPVHECLKIAMLACSHVIHQLGTSGSCTPEDILTNLNLLR